MDDVGVHFVTEIGMRNEHGCHTVWREAHSKDDTRGKPVWKITCRKGWRKRSPLDFGRQNSAAYPLYSRRKWEVAPRLRFVGLRLESTKKQPDRTGLAPRRTQTAALPELLANRTSHRREHVI